MLKHPSVGEGRQRGSEHRAVLPRSLTPGPGGKRILRGALEGGRVFGQGPFFCLGDNVCHLLHALVNPHCWEAQRDLSDLRRKDKGIRGVQRQRHRSWGDCLGLGEFGDWRVEPGAGERRRLSVQANHSLWCLLCPAAPERSRHVISGKRPLRMQVCGPGGLGEVGGRAHRAGEIS